MLLSVEAVKMVLVLSLLVLGLLHLSCCGNAFEEPRSSGVLLQALKRHDCVEKWEACDGSPRCCGTTHCYWQDGYSPLTDGFCVECVDRTLVCQRDEQCCTPLVCQKGGSLHLDGVCDIKYAVGDVCNRDDNCESGQCDEPWHGIGLGVCVEINQ